MAHSRRTGSIPEDHSGSTFSDHVLLMKLNYRDSNDLEEI